MIFLQTVAVAFGMFSAVPVPQPEWNEKNMRYVLCAFPLVGAACGAAWALWAAACARLGAPEPLRAGGLCVLPVLLTGGLHLDGYADTCDALASCGDAAEKQRILKDPHCGAFAVIRLCVWFAADLALCAALTPTPRALGCMAAGFVLERALSGWAVAALPTAKDTGLVHLFAASADKTSVRRALAVLCALLGGVLLALGGAAGAAMLCAALLALWRYARTAKTQFGGISGDLNGWFLQKCELWMLAALVLCQCLR